MLSDRNVLSDSSLKGRRRRMRTRACIIRKDSKAGRYFSDICCKSKALRNTTNFYIRNTYTGIMKSPEERTDNENEVLHNVITGIKMYNEHKLLLFKRTSGRPALQAALRDTLQCGRRLSGRSLSDIRQGKTGCSPMKCWTLSSSSLRTLSTTASPHR